MSGGVPLNMDPVTGEVYDDQDDVFATLREREALVGAQATRIVELERENGHLREMFVVNDQVMADQAARIAELENQLATSRALVAELTETRGQLRETLDVVAAEQLAERERATARIAELEIRAEEADELRLALHRAQERAQTASDAAESYRVERNAARTTINRIARLIEL